MKKKSYLIGNAHIDPIWLWNWQEGCTEVRNTFRSALDRLKETDGWFFSASSARYYKWIEELFPDMFEEIRARVKEGRWNIVGGWWVQPDCNLPSGESFCRQSLYGQRYFLEKFGITAKTGYNVDSFGHNGGLPQILKKSGLENYVFSRPGAHEAELPPLFEWMGADGSSVRAARIPIGYESNSLPELKAKTEKFERLTAEKDVSEMLFFGVGNHGGGPTKEMLGWLCEVKDERNFEFSSADGYFKSVSSVSVPQVCGTLGKHATGCYSADSKIKRGNRRAESSLLTAEKFACLAFFMYGAKYPYDRLRGAWERLLFNQFHDALCGCSIRPVGEGITADFSQVAKTAEELINEALQRISAKIDTCGGVRPEEAKSRLGIPMVVFNPGSTQGTFTVRVSRLFVQRDKKFKKYEAYSADGICVPVQPVQGESLFWHTRDGIFRAEVPAYGYRLFYIRETDSAYRNVRAEETNGGIPEGTFNRRIGKYVLENGALRVEISENGGLTLIKDKKKRSVLSFKETRFTVDEDCSIDTWGHASDSSAWEISKKLGIWGFCNNRLGEEVGRFDCTGVSIAECGPVRSVIRSLWKYGRSGIICDYILYDDADCLETEIKIDWQERQKTARWLLPCSLKGGEFESAYCHEWKKNIGEEEFAHKWVDIDLEKHGFTLLNDGAYSYRMNEKGLSVVLARSAVYADHAGVRENSFLYDHMDLGEQKFRFLIRPRRKADYGEITALGNRFNDGCVWLREGYHDGDYPSENSFLRCEEKNISVRAIKRAEDGGGYILRASETEGRQTDCDLSLFSRVVSCIFRPYEIKTLLISDDGSVAEKNILEF